MQDLPFQDNDRLRAVREQVYAMPLDQIDVSDADLYRTDTHWPYFDRLRIEAPVHLCPDSRYGPYWSVTRFEDMKYVDSHHEVFSSEPSIGIFEQLADFELPMFIAMDRPKHDAQRKSVAPVVAPGNLKKLESTIRERATTILDSLPLDEPFNWVDRVSIELTTQMLALLFDFPFDERRKLTRWSDVTTGGTLSGVSRTKTEREEELRECLAYFQRLWHERAGQEPGTDLISMMAHNPDMQDMPPQEFLGNLLLLIVGGNDTTRNSISGGVLALNQYPDQYDLLRDQPDLIPNMAAEIIRWQTPLTHMRRTCLTDTELADQQLKKGDKVVMWYVSGNRDDAAFDDPYAFRIDRPNARQHVSFGYGIHRCMGNRLAEMQLRILWEEILARFHCIEVLEPPERIRSNQIKGYQTLTVQLHA